MHVTELLASTLPDDVHIKQYGETKIFRWLKLQSGLNTRKPGRYSTVSRRVWTCLLLVCRWEFVWCEKQECMCLMWPDIRNEHSSASVESHWDKSNYFDLIYGNNRHSHTWRSKSQSPTTTDLRTLVKMWKDGKSSRVNGVKRHKKHWAHRRRSGVRRLGNKQEVKEWSRNDNLVTWIYYLK
jgi:hypothetical protein